MKEKSEKKPTQLNKYVASIASAIYAQDKSFDRLKEAYKFFIEELKE